MSKPLEMAKRVTLPGVTLTILIVFLAVVMVRIAFQDTSIPIASDDTGAAAGANERLLQMVQWSLTTVLGLGLVLVGINWFQTNRDRNEIKALEQRLQEAISDFETRVSRLQEASDAAEETLIQYETERLLRSGDGVGTSSIDYCLRQAQEETDPRRQIALAKLAMKYASGPHAISGADYQALQQAIPFLRQLDPNLAADASQALLKDSKMAAALPETERA